LYVGENASAAIETPQEIGWLYTINLRKSTAGIVWIFTEKSGIFVVAQSGFRDIYTNGMIGYERR